MKKQWVRVAACVLLWVLFCVPAAAFTNGEWLYVEKYEQRQNWHIDRGEFCEYLLKLYDYVTWDKPLETANPFRDVKEEEHPYVVPAYSLGLVQGTDATTFHPKHQVTHAEASVMLLRVICKMYPDTDLSGGEAIRFPDGVPSWAEESLRFMVSRGLMQWEAGFANMPMTLKEVVCTVDQVMRTRQYPVVHHTFPNVRKVYLTFDDGISVHTTSILNTLRSYNVPATFFVTGKIDPSVLCRMKEEGHAVGNHSLTHEYQKIYQSPRAFWQDFDAQNTYLQGVLGYLPTLMRFPGGSNNQYGGNGMMQTICRQAKEYGYLYFDWNVDSGDARGTNVSPETILQNVLDGCRYKTDAVVLMHGYKKTTAQALPEIIRQLKEMGFVFLPLDEYAVRPQFVK